MQELRANTQIVVTVGPFLDVGDGFVPEVGITLGAADEAELVKHGTTAGIDISARTWAVLNPAVDGYYNLTLTTTDTNTEGMLLVVIQDDSVCLPINAKYKVLSEAAYDSKYVAKDTGYMDVNVKAVSEDTDAADKLETFVEGSALGTLPKIDVVQWLTQACAAVSVNGVPEVDITHIGGVAANLATEFEADLKKIDGDAQSMTDLKDLVDTGYDPATHKVQGVVLTDTTTAVTNEVSADVTKINADAAAAARLSKSAGSLLTGTVDTVTNGHAPTTTEFQADDITEATADHFAGRVIIFTSGNLQYQACTISAYAQVGGIGQFTTTTLTEAPANNDTFVIV